ncbi:MAG: aminopeptidase P family protein, partial [Alphaproteobacteria bacterium]|nr:aminopeptidase P family protein [Alphaproteobacteria bacterium]
MNDATPAGEEIARLPFEPQEYARRMALLHAEMDRRGLDAVLITVPQNYYYLTGFELGAAHSLIFLVVPRTGEGAWVTRKTEQSNVRAFAPLIPVKRGYGVDDSSDYIDVLAGVLRDMGLGEGRIGVEESSLCFTIAQYRRLQQVCPRAALCDITGLVEKFRSVKSEAELAYMRRAGAISATALHACFDALHEGVTDSELAAVLIAAAIRAGSGRMGMQPFVAAGPRTFRAHASWNGSPIRRGEVINVELASQVRHYHVPTFRVFVVGAPSDEIRRMHDASEAGMRAGMAGIGPGMTSHAADRVVRDAIEKTGYGENFVVRAAYGIGIALAPGWGETPDVMAIRPDDQRVLAPGMCFHLVPALYKEGV